MKFKTSVILSASLLFLIVLGWACAIHYRLNHPLQPETIQEVLVKSFEETPNDWTREPDTISQVYDADFICNKKCNIKLRVIGYSQNVVMLNPERYDFSDEDEKKLIHAFTNVAQIKDKIKQKELVKTILNCNASPK